MNRRTKFSRFVRNVAGDFGRPDATAAAGSNTKVGDLVWGIFVVLVLILAVFLAWKLPASRAQYSVAILLGASIGISMLYWIPDKILLTAVGGVLGIFLSDLTGAAGVMEKTAVSLAKIVSIINAASEGDLALRPLSAWLLLGVVLICCLPAYRTQSGDG